MYRLCRPREIGVYAAAAPSGASDASPNQNQNAKRFCTRNPGPDPLAAVYTAQRAYHQCCTI